MFQCSVYYSRTEDASFDHAYYLEQHIPMVVKALGPDSTVVEQGVEGPHIAAAHFTFASREDFDMAMERYAAAGLPDDRLSFTSITAVRQLSETVLL